MDGQKGVASGLKFRDKKIVVQKKKKKSAVNVISIAANLYGD
jgi:hypothetical protein